MTLHEQSQHHASLPGALSKNKPAKEAFEKLPASRQKEILRYLNNLKQAETLERNLSEGDPIFTGTVSGRTRGCHSHESRK